jgi:predicted amidohydrolase
VSCVIGILKDNNKAIVNLSVCQIKVGVDKLTNLSHACSMVRKAVEQNSSQLVVLPVSL